ncbi:MAG: Rne/Rng family ribonuclease [Corynebacteriales bacterium]|nr:Rne/Rng family ribonuclease [Mycobacteriales bacterium]
MLANEPAGTAPNGDGSAYNNSNSSAAAPPAIPVMFMAPQIDAPAPRREKPAKAEPADEEPAPRRRSRKSTAESERQASEEPSPPAESADDSDDASRQRRRRGRRGRGRGRSNGEAEESTSEATTDSGKEEPKESPVEPAAEATDEEQPSGTARRRRRKRRREGHIEGDDTTETSAAKAPEDEVQGVKGSARLEAKRQRRRDGREQRRSRPSILTEAEFLARRESVERVMAVRERGDVVQIAVLEDNVLVEHYVTRSSSVSYVGNVYLGKVQNVLPSMEAAFVDIGKGRNAVLYAGEVNWDTAGLEGKPRKIEQALKAGDSVLVQVTKDPIGHKGARLTSQISLPGRFLVYVPGGGMTGISRKLPDTERKRLKDILKSVVPEDAGVIVRTAAEGATEEELARDVARLKAQWETIDAKSAKGASSPTMLSEEPDLIIRVIRDIFNEDFAKLIVEGEKSWDLVEQYVAHVSPDLVERLEHHVEATDLFADLRVDEQLAKALDRKVWLPSGGSLVIDRTEAMTVVDVNTGKFTGQGGSLEETVTRNNLEAAEEIVRQLRLRDIGGIIVIDFIDMVLESNRDLVLRRLTECLGRDRTRHQVAEVTSLGLVQMTRKRVGQGLLEAFSEPCEHCRGRGLLVHTEPIAEHKNDHKGDHKNQGGKKAADNAGSKSEGGNKFEGGRGRKHGAKESKEPSQAEGA